MPCPSCLTTIERGGQALYEVTQTHPDELPPLPPLTSWIEVSRALIHLAATLRRQDREPAAQVHESP